MPADRTSVPGVRATRQRAAIATVLDESAGFRSAQELHEELRRRNEDIGLATVYRALQTMVTAGVLDTVRTETGEALYRRCSAHHHHHLVCRECGVTAEVEAGAIEMWAAKLVKQHGFSDATHIAEISGVCANCSGAGS